jgi:hypothetical protein
MMKSAIAAVIGLIVGGIVILAPSSHQVAVATGLVVMSIFLHEGTIIDKLAHKK